MLAFFIGLITAVAAGYVIYSIASAINWLAVTLFWRNLHRDDQWVHLATMWTMIALSVLTSFVIYKIGTAVINIIA